MEALREHLAVVLSIGAGILLVAGIVLVIERAPARTQQALSWSGNTSALQNPTAYGANPVLDALPGPSFSTDAPAFLPLKPAPQAGEDQGQGAQDLASLLAELAAPTASSTGNISIGSSLAYQFIPQGLISTSIPTAHRSEAQQALYDYGNEVGSSIRTFETQAGSAPQILQDQAQDRSDPAKAQAVKRVGAALIYIGTSMDKMESVPSGVSAYHKALAKSYETMGQNLQKIPDAASDQSFIEAIQTYNSSAETFAKDFVALADYFSLNQVKFSSDDPGSVFMFSAGGTL